MIVTTTPGIEGRAIRYLGVVAAQGVLGVNVQDVAAGMRNIFGGRRSPTRTSSPPV